MGLGGWRRHWDNLLVFTWVPAAPCLGERLHIVKDWRAYLGRLVWTMPRELVMCPARCQGVAAITGIQPSMLLSRDTLAHTRHRRHMPLVQHTHVQAHACPTTPLSRHDLIYACTGLSTPLSKHTLVQVPKHSVSKRALPWTSPAECLLGSRPPHRQAGLELSGGSTPDLLSPPPPPPVATSLAWGNHWRLVVSGSASEILR